MSTKNLPASTVKSNVTVLDSVSKLPIGHVNAAASSFQMLVEAHYQYKTTVQVEKTKRAAISAWRDTKVLELNNQKEILELYLKESFKERAKSIEGFFNALDKGIASGNDHLIDQSLGAILAIAKQSPLAEAEKLMMAMRDPNTKSIEL